MSVYAGGKLLSPQMSAQLASATPEGRASIIGSIVAELHRRRRETLRKKSKSEAEKLRVCPASL